MFNSFRLLAANPCAWLTKHQLLPLQFRSCSNRVDQPPLTTGDRYRVGKFLNLPEKPCPLFQSWEAYSKSLPVRQVYNTFYHLDQLPHWCQQQQMQQMATQLGQNPTRKRIKYLCARSASGKTKSVLVAFLHSNYDHYLYIPFSNNEDQNFSTTESLFEEAQKLGFDFKVLGSIFILHVLKSLLIHQSYNPFVSKELDLEGLLSKYKDMNLIAAAAKQEYDQLLQMYFPKKSLLIHVDEHGHMCLRTRPWATKGARFSRGALGLLNRSTDVTVVATYTHPPSFLPHAKSSANCREPVILPRLDPQLVVIPGKTPGELYAPFQIPDLKDQDVSDLNARERRLYSSLMVRLCNYLSTEAWHNFLHSRFVQQAKPDEKKESWMAKFNETLNQKTPNGKYVPLSQRLSDCSKLFPPYAAPPPRSDLSATDLLLGIQEDCASTYNKQFRELVVLPEEPENEGLNLGGELSYLMRIKDPNRTVYWEGVERMRAVFGNGDLMSSKPLEEAFAWTLACKSNLSGQLFLASSAIYSIRVVTIQNGRLFQDATMNSFDVQAVKQLQTGVLYRSFEKQMPHPLADIFFQTLNRQVVLVDVTGGQFHLATTKGLRLLDQLPQLQNKLDQNNPDQLRLVGLVLAPYTTDSVNGSEEFQKQFLEDQPGVFVSRDQNTPVVVLVGFKARESLGALTQVQWFYNPQDRNPPQ